MDVPASYSPFAYSSALQTIFFVLSDYDSDYDYFILLGKNLINSKEVGPLTANLALSLIKFMKYGIEQFLLYE